MAAVHEAFHQEDAPLAGRFDHACRSTAASSVIGFSHSTCLPAAIAASACVSCDGCGRARCRRRRRPGRASSSARIAARRRQRDHLLANACALRGRRADDVDDAAAFGSPSALARSRPRCRPCRRRPTAERVLHECCVRVLLGGELVDHRVLVGLARLEDDLVAPGGDVDRVGELLRSRGRARPSTGRASRPCPWSSRP